ncbi:Hypothetical_protein [Hexamita inflata]|uniref:Hypothetical_protein n=1 Tax=Hexamita inflata TaxID=28002 RepID=A0ABP1I1P5_9EUKA
MQTDAKYRMEQARLKKEQIKQFELDRNKQGTLNLSRHKDYLELQKLRAEKKIQKVQKPMQFRVDADQADVDEIIEKLLNITKKTHIEAEIIISKTKAVEKEEPKLFQSPGRYYTLCEKYVAVILYIRVGRSNYVLIKSLLFAYANQTLPNERTVRRMKQQLIVDFEYDLGQTGYEFTDETSLTHVDNWLVENNLAGKTDIAALLQVDAININRRASLDKNGNPVGTIKNIHGKEVPISYLFVFVLVAEVESTYLPVFSMFAADGACRDQHIQCFKKIAERLREKGLIINLLGHDGDQKYAREDAAGLECIKYNFIKRKILNAYALIQPPKKRGKTEPIEGYHLCWSMPDGKHLLKCERNLENFGKPLSTSYKLDNQYIRKEYLQEVLSNLDKSVFDSSYNLKMSDISALKMYSTDSVQRLMERARLNQEDDDSVDSKMSRIKAFLYFMLHTPIVSLDLQCDSYYLQEMFTLVLFVLIQQHEQQSLAFHNNFFLTTLYFQLKYYNNARLATSIGVLYILHIFVKYILVFAGTYLITRTIWIHIQEFKRIYYQSADQ